MVAARNLVASVLLVSGTSNAFLGGNIDMSTLMKLSAMSRQFKVDQIQGEQKQALMEYAGFNDMELFMSKQISADEFKTSMKQQFKDNLIQSVLQNGGIDLTNPLFRKTFFNDIEDSESFTMGMPEPMQSIIRLMRADTTANSDSAVLRKYGKDLLKKLQYEKFNTDNGNMLTDNLDEIMLATDKKAVIKEILEQSMYNNFQDPLDRAMMYYMTAKRNADTATAEKYKTQIKDLQKIKIFQSSVPKSSPVTDDNLFAFYRMVNGKVEAADVLNVALGEQLGPISELDFERYFGSPAKQFSCRSHTDTIRVPCGIKLKPDECVAAGCCYLASDGAGVPDCYHDLYGKIGSGMLRREWFKDSEITNQISNLFVDNTIPTIDKILRDDLPDSLYGARLNTYDPSTDKYTQAGIDAVEYQNKNWWDVSQVQNFEDGPNEGQTGYEPLRKDKGSEKGGAYLWNQQQGARRYGRKNYQWKPHGPTQSPFFNDMPGVNPTANPLNNGLGSLDDYYKIWLEYASAQDQAQCALIPEQNRVKCMENYEALVNNVRRRENPTTVVDQCELAGCCFNEDSFLKGKPACYRATDYGQCRNLPGNFQKRECGYEGISEQECLNNARCCYEPSAERKDPWCYYKYSATLDENQWCAAWSEERFRDVPRDACFTNPKSKSNIFNDNTAHNINNLIGKEQCEASDCCFDESLDTDYVDWLQEGLGYDKVFRCFKKRNPLVVMNERYMKQVSKTTQKDILAEGKKQDKGTFGLANVDTTADKNKIENSQSLENVAINLNEFADGTEKLNPHTFTKRVKTCDANNWEMYGTVTGNKGLKRTCGENLSYYQCVYVKRCCYKATVSNEPVCYYPEWKKDSTSPYGLSLPAGVAAKDTAGKHAGKT